LQTIFGIAVPITWLFEAPTVAKLSARIDEVLRLEQGTRMPPLLPMTRPPRLPLSFAQQRLWFLDQLEPGSSAYNFPLAVRLHGPLQRQALWQALQALVHRHENLRTSFPLADEQPVQYIHPKPLTPLLVLDLSHLDPQEREQEARRLARQEAEEPFDLAHGPLLRCHLLQVAQQEDQVLLLSMHHIISDGWSGGILERELISLYTAFSQGQAPSLPSLPIQYADFALWQRSWLQGDVLEQQLTYWKQHLTGITPLELPIDHPRPVFPTFQGALQRLSGRRSS